MNQDQVQNNDDIFCGGSVLTCAKVVCVIGMIAAVLGFGWFIYLIFADYAIYRFFPPIICIVFFAGYILAFVGVVYRKPGYLVPAMIFTVLTFIAGAVLAGLFLLGLIESGNAILMIIVAASVAVFVYNIWAFGVISKTRRYLINNSTNFNATP